MSLKTYIDKLPARCYALMPGSDEVIYIELGMQGYYQTGIRGDQEHVDKRNSALGVTPAQREAMLAGSMFGWDLPAADPGLYDECGALR